MVDKPWGMESHNGVDLPLTLTGSQTTQPPANRPNQQPPDSVHTAAPYFEGAESISSLGLPQFLGLILVPRRKPVDLTQVRVKIQPVRGWQGQESWTVFRQQARVFASLEL